jgi:hypothetical protein
MQLKRGFGGCGLALGRYWKDFVGSMLFRERLIYAELKTEAYNFLITYNVNIYHHH